MSGSISKLMWFQDVQKPMEHVCEGPPECSEQGQDWPQLFDEMPTQPHAHKESRKLGKESQKRSAVDLCASWLADDDNPPKYLIRWLIVNILSSLHAISI